MKKNNNPKKLFFQKSAAKYKYIRHTFLNYTISQLRIQSFNRLDPSLLIVLQFADLQRPEPGLAV